MVHVDIFWKYQTALTRVVVSWCETSPLATLQENKKKTGQSCQGRWGSFASRQTQTRKLGGGRRQSKCQQKRKLVVCTRVDPVFSVLKIIMNCGHPNRPLILACTTFGHPNRPLILPCTIFSPDSTQDYPCTKVVQFSELCTFVRRHGVEDCTGLVACSSASNLLLVIVLPVPAAIVCCEYSAIFVLQFHLRICVSVFWIAILLDWNDSRWPY